MSRGFGVASGLDPTVAAPLAERCAALGYDAIWSNDTPLASGLATLADFAAGSNAIDLGVTLALDRHEPAAITAQVDELGLPRDRLWIGVGAGHWPKALTAMREALPRLRDALGDVRLLLAAMGPKMSALGGAEFDGVFFNWITPSFAASAREHVERGAREAGRETPPIFGYIRTAVGPDANRRLTKEELFYRDLHDGYRKHFARLAEPEGTVGIAAPGAAEAQHELSAYEALDVPVVRALASGNLEAMSALAEATAPVTSNQRPAAG
jgi:alkanesulfonate monooxygenase SsuD/methylene tetrahydromethanopterin reductase-like flavin-dependent oxidoreductase (luciferase family)